MVVGIVFEGDRYTMVIGSRRGKVFLFAMSYCLFYHWSDPDEVLVAVMGRGLN